ncbi:alpha/beta hydrolase [Promicromonospora sp. CA-289599]|uniref:alpha/beta hydrolase n=1 Tax=Promicromonospora sp. CA-289599 TaxID=3240014 RepID=UPI003D904E02
MTELNQQAQAIIDAAAASGLPPVYQLPTEESRARMRAAFIQGEPESIPRLEDFVVPTEAEDIRARLYHPEPGGQLPLLLFFHGGGWIVNDLDTHDRLCSIIAKEARVAVLSVDYRRSPENKYPAAIEDARQALAWAANHRASLGVNNQIAVGGDSSGGTIAVSLAKQTRDFGGPAIAAQFLLYPVTDYLEPETASYVQRGVGYSLNRAFMEWAWSAYLPEAWDRSDPYLFPLQGDQVALPPTIIYTAEFDPLRDEGAALADAMAKAGVTVSYVNADDQMHGFAMQTRAIDRAAKILSEACSALRRMLEGLGDRVDP